MLLEVLKNLEEVALACFRLGEWGGGAGLAGAESKSPEVGRAESTGGWEAGLVWTLQSWVASSSLCLASWLWQQRVDSLKPRWQAG